MNVRKMWVSKFRGGLQGGLGDGVEEIEMMGKAGEKLSIVRGLEMRGSLRGVVVRPCHVLLQFGASVWACFEG